MLFPPDDGRISAGVHRQKDNPAPVSGKSWVVSMSISQEWTKVIRDVHGIFLAIRTSLGFTWAGTSGTRSKPRAIRITTTRITMIPDSRVLAELERRKNLALLNNARTSVR